MQFTPVSFERKYFRTILLLGLLAMLVAIGMFAYLGTFSRYFADDYCEAVRVNRESPFAAVSERYLAGSTRSANRYSNLFFVGISEMLARNSIPITIPAMVVLWVIGLSWCAHELRRFFRIDWFLPVDFFWGLTLGFFSLLLAPNLFQSVYWRSAMMTHFAPLVFGAFLSAYTVRQLRNLQIEAPSPLAHVIVFLGSFLVAGFSEPPVATMVTTLPLLMGAVWFWGKAPVKQKHLALLAWAFAGALLGFLILVFSPASINVVETRQRDALAVLGLSFYYSYLFIIDSLKISPVPFVIIVFLPFSFIWLYKQAAATPLSRNQIYLLLLGSVIIPVFMWLLIAASFAPSVYGQNYNFPVERTRFLARTIVIMALIAEGIIFGYLLHAWRFKYNPFFGQWAVLLSFAVLAIVYPLRAAWNVYQFDVPIYRSHAEQWDLRDVQIREAIAAGAKDLTVQQLDSFGGAPEYKGNATHWVNRCAARYYGLNSIIAP
jgi:hypothetical protein